MNTITSTSVHHSFIGKHEFSLTGTGGLVATDGGRYDVNVYRREKYSAYTPEEPKPLIRASWYLITDDIYEPFSEEKSAWLEVSFPVYLSILIIVGNA